jgi:large subunit ribosomal protein L20
MARVKRGILVAKKHRKIKKAVKGYSQIRRSSIKKAKEAILKAGQHSYFDRKKKKGNFRKLWILKINAACKLNGISYREFIYLLKQNKIEMNRKVLSQLAEKHPEIFEEIVGQVKVKK